MVHLGKISSWFLLVIISIIIVANLKHFKYGRGQSTRNTRAGHKETSAIELSDLL